MKKPATFFIAWDAAVILLLYLNSLKEMWMTDYIRKTMDITVKMWSYPITPLIFGCLIACLVYAGTKYSITKKTMLLEMILIGIPALYIAFSPVLYYIFPGAFGFYVPVPLYWLTLEHAYDYGIIVLGYEIGISVFRMIKMHNTHKKNMEESSKDNTIHF